MPTEERGNVYDYEVPTKEMSQTGNLPVNKVLASKKKENEGVGVRTLCGFSEILSDGGQK